MGCERAAAMMIISLAHRASCFHIACTSRLCRRRRKHDGLTHHLRTSTFLPRPVALVTLATSRLFGCDPGSGDARAGDIFLSDDRDVSEIEMTPINLSALHRTIHVTRDVIGYPTYDVSLSLVDDEFMQEVNEQTRGVPKPTDVLSFCFQESFLRPGVLGKVPFDIPENYNLGDMLIDVDYVRRRCEEDRRMHEEEIRRSTREEESGVIHEGEVLGESESPQSSIDESGDDDEYEYIEVEIDDWDDRGVAPAMQRIYNPELRVHFLVVHGMLHLVGYDHIEDDDYELMVEREDEVLAELKVRLGVDFGL
ncbi:hypothetical protein THAOC_13918 [Thalassiosira oceanica]|uniref:YbeY/UPF0054 family metalloprotein n=1 Tax=Thalassiosira oceanica TaxID=159749 RepID=K0T4I2_THAOC|nr:hypothetical protein THAOC_13918 [Thalassiosira oceanica]|eukprot:EJK65247.1 hypothetical protein THAOC_13918 [Thalassiosira oceanica]